MSGLQKTYFIARLPENNVDDGGVGGSGGGGDGDDDDDDDVDFVVGNSSNDEYKKLKFFLHIQEKKIVCVCVYLDSPLPLVSRVYPVQPVSFSPSPHALAVIHPTVISLHTCFNYDTEKM